MHDQEPNLIPDERIQAHADERAPLTTDSLASEAPVEADGADEDAPFIRLSATQPPESASGIVDAVNVASEVPVHGPHQPSHADFEIATDWASDAASEGEASTASDDVPAEGSQEEESRVPELAANAGLADEEFNPDHPAFFDNLVEDYSGETPAGAARAVAVVDQPDEFLGFESDLGTLPTPAFRLSLATAELQRIVKLHELCSPSGRKPGAVRFSISADHTTAQIHEDAFCELKLTPSSLDLAPGVKAVIFIRGGDLRTAARALEDDVEMHFVPALKTVQLKSNNFERPLLLERPAAFTALSEHFIGAVLPGSKQPIPAILASGIRHVAPHVVRNHINESLNGIDCQSGAMVGGRTDVIAKFSAPSLEQFDFCFSHEHADAISYAIAGLGSDSMMLTTHFYVLTVGDLILGVPRFQKRSKILTLKLPIERDRHLLVPRSSLRNALTRVHHAIGEDAVVHLSSKALAAQRLVIRASSSDGTALRDPIECQSSYEQFKVSVSCADLLTAIGKHVSVHVLLRLTSNNLVVDDVDGDLEAITIIAGSRSQFNSSEEVHELPEQIEP